MIFMTLWPCHIVSAPVWSHEAICDLLHCKLHCLQHCRVQLQNFLDECEKIRSFVPTCSWEPQWIYPSTQDSSQHQDDVFSREISKKSLKKPLWTWVGGRSNVSYCWHKVVICSFCKASTVEPKCRENGSWQFALWASWEAFARHEPQYW